MPGSSLRTAAHLPAVLAALLILGCDEPAGEAGPPPPPDVSAAVERLGNPFGEVPPFARNVWDMLAFDGRVYVGHGDSRNNVGPVGLWSVDPATGRLAREYDTSEEQVDVFRVLGGELFVPGHDPRDDWDLGNFYRRQAGGAWVKRRTIPDGLHTFDLAQHDGKLFAALGSRLTPGYPALKVSDDDGQTWAPVTEETRRFYSFFTLAGRLHAVPLMGGAGDTAAARVQRWNGQRFVPTPWGADPLLVGAPAGAHGRMVRATEFGGRLLYVSAFDTFFWQPWALATLSPEGTVARVSLPDPAALPFDILTRADSLYLLTGSPAAAGYTVRVYATRDLSTWREAFHFTAATFARSFEEHGGDWYFGLGSLHEGSPHPSTGDLLRVRRASYTDR